MITDAFGLGAYLRTLRAQTAPESLGLSVSGRERRVPGLRREEIARLAGLSVSYYTSLEQGRALHASPEVLHAIAGALRLDEVEEAHLLDLAAARADRRGSRQRYRQPAAALRRFLEAMPEVPAVAHDSALDVVGWNPLGRALYAPYLQGDRVNLARMVFLEPWCRDFYVDWQAKAETLVAVARLVAGREPHNAALSGLIAELRGKSPDFARMWSSQRVRAPAAATIELRHPRAGRITVTQQALTGFTPSDTYIVVTTAEPGSESQERLRLLAAASVVTA